MIRVSLSEEDSIWITTKGTKGYTNNTKKINSKKIFVPFV